MTTDKMVYIQAQGSVLEGCSALMWKKSQSVLFVKSVVFRREFAHEF